MNRFPLDDPGDIAVFHETPFLRKEAGEAPTDETRPGHVASNYETEVNWVSSIKVPHK
jgi:hypothetical protein